MVFMSPAAPDGVATLEFDPAKLVVGKDKDLREGLSAVAFSDGDLWLACDEGARLDRLSRSSTAALQFGAHTVFELADLVQLPAPSTEEADIEGLAIDDGWLWLVGSHSRKRSKPKDGGPPAKVAEKLADLERDGNRHLLARIPLEGRLPKPGTASRKAGTVPASPTSSALLEAFRRHEDPHLAPFVDIPGKDNGLDIEGLAVHGMRVMVGLRGPVLREWCCVLELHLEAESSGALRLTPIDGSVPYRKHFLKLHGLGPRDLAWLDDDLLILAGPSMAHDGPIEIWRWKQAGIGGSPVAADRLFVLAHGEGTDRAEGIAVVDQGLATRALLVVFDSPDATRLIGPSAVRADLYRLP